MTASHNSDHIISPLLQHLRRKTNLTSRQVADEAGVPLRVEYLMEIGGIVTPEDAKKVLAAFSRLTGKQYSLQNVQVHLTHQAAHLSDQKPEVVKTARCHSPIRKVHLRS